MLMIMPEIFDFIMLTDLTEMGLKLGKKAALQNAIEHWSVPHVAA